MSDRPTLATAATSAEVCEAVARATWAKAKAAGEPWADGEPRIPGPDDLAAAALPVDAVQEAVAISGAVVGIEPPGTLMVAPFGGPDGAPPAPPMPGGLALYWVWLPVRTARPDLAPSPDPATASGAVIEAVHGAWRVLPDGERGRHPMAPLVAAWQRRPPDLPGAMVTVTGSRSPMARRPVLVSTTLRTPWIAAVNVDGEPMIAQVSDPGAVFDAWNKPERRRQYRPKSLQRELRLPGVPPAPHDLRLASLATLDPRHGMIDDATPALAGDVLTLLAYAHAIDRAMVLTEREGAALLARTRTGEFRRPRETDVERFRLASAYLRSLTVWDPRGTFRWLDLAKVSATRAHTDGGWSVEIGPPAWARPIEGKWTLTAEGSTAARLRPTAGEGSMAGRIITGIEYRLAARFDGRRGIAPDLRPLNGRAAGPGRPVKLPWRDVLRLAGDYWDPTDPAADKAARMRFDRAVAWLDRADYWAAHPRAEATAGDAVEVLDRTRGSRARPPALVVRASARFVEAARLAQMPGGKGFGALRLTDYAGLNDPE